MITHKQIAAFREVMRNGSLTAAAEYLHTSQPGVSRLIRDLEDQTGLQLFTRHGSKVIPTTSAHDFWDIIERSFIGLDYIWKSSQRIRLGEKNKLSIAAAPVFASTIVSDSITIAIKNNIISDISSVHVTTLPVVRQVALRRAELGVNLLSHHQHEVDLIKSYNIPYYVIFNSEHRYSTFKSINLIDLENENYIGFEDSTITGQVQNKWFSTMKNPPKTVATSYLSSVISSLVLNDIGVSIVDPWTARTHEILGGKSLILSNDDQIKVSLIKPLGLKNSIACLDLIEIIDKKMKSEEI